MRNAFVTAAFAAGLGISAHAVAGHNYSDFWGATNGATLNIVQQGSSVVVTGFLYDAARQPTWISFGGTLDDNDTFTSNVIQNAGDPPSNNWTSNWNPYVVGAATLQFTSKSSGTLTLTLNGNTTTGTIRRAKVGNLPITGQYVSTTIEVYQGCNSRQNGLYSTVGYFTVQVNDAGDTLSGSFNAVDSSIGCSYSLPFTQSGSVATGNGSFSCSDGTSGDVAVDQLRAFDGMVTIKMTRTFTSGDTCVTTTFLSGSD